MKRNININRTPISSEEIQKGKNFSELAKAYQTTVAKPFYKKAWFSGTVASAVLLTTALIVLNTKNEEKETVNNNEITTVITDTTQTKFINPPAPGIDVKKDRYFVNAGTGGEIIHHTGSKIKIPANSFIKEDGTPVNGEVEIQYREFHDQIDIFFSGIPMNYDSAGVQYNFESAGMMEIYAYQNGEKLKLAPKKELAISMTSYNPDAKFNLYYLDEEAKNWDYRGKDKIESQNEQDFTYQPGKIDNSEMIDNDLFTDKKEAIKEQEQVVEVIKKDIIKIEEKKPNKPIKAQKNVHSFNLDVSKTEFPEIAEYGGTVFEVIDQVNFDTKIYDTQWEDIELTQKNNGLCIQLTKGKNKKIIDVKPVLEGDDYTAAIKKFSEKFETYSKKLASRKEYEKKAIAELKSRREAYEKALIEREKQIEKQIKLYTDQQKSTAIYQRIFNVNRFGTWNCDSPISNPPSGSRIFAKYINNNTKKEISFSRLDLIEQDRNAIWSLYGEKQTFLSFNPRKKYILWGFTSEGQVAYTATEDFDKIKEVKTYDFKMTIIDIHDKNIDDLKELIKA